MDYKVIFSKRAQRKFESLPRDIQKKLQPVINSLAKNPRPSQATNVKELDRCYRIREGDFRIVYAVQDDQLIVLVLAVADRKEVYSNKEMALLRKILREWQGSQRKGSD